MTGPDPVGPEWPLAVAADRVTTAPLTIEAVADERVRAALAQRFGIVAIAALAAEVTLRRLTDGDIAATARLRAQLTQACVVTLDPVDETVDVTVEGRFTARPIEDSDGDVVVDPDDESDEPEPIVDGQLALGEWLSQNLSLAMDPFPRAPGAVLESDQEPEGPGKGPAGQPFAGLAGLRGRREDDAS